MSGRRAVVVGVDVGTTSTKAGVYDAEAREHHVVRLGYPLHAPEPGRAEQDADDVAEAALAALAEAVRVARDDDRDVAAVVLSTPMHGLVGLDGDARPVTPLLTWGDGRAGGQARHLREHHRDVYDRTGTPLHPMSPLAKLRWYAEASADVVDEVATWSTHKEHLLHRLTGRLLVDEASASATGLLALDGRTWDAGALDLAHVDADRLADVVTCDHVVDGLRPEVAHRLRLPTSTPVVVGATDGVLAQLGVGARADDHVGVVNVGTSGALRVTSARPDTDPLMRTFCYAGPDGSHVVGGAISNGGLWLRWLREQVLDERLGFDELTARAAAVPPGADGVVILPWLAGERAPRWLPGLTGQVHGLRHEHGLGHLVRAGMEGVCHQLALVRDAMADDGLTVGRVTATGGFTGSPVWVQTLADVLGVPVEVPRVDEAVALGAALLGLRAVGLRDDVDPHLHVDAVVHPDPTTTAAVAAAHARYADLVAAAADAAETGGGGGAP